MTDDVRNLGTVGRALPGVYQDNQQIPQRLGRRGEVYTLNLMRPRMLLSDEGTYFVAHNATNDAATTLAGHAAPVLADADSTMTKPFIHLRMDPAATVRAYLDFIEIEVITAGLNGTADSWAAQLDTGATRVSSGGTALTRISPNMQSTATPGLACLGGAVVTGAESANVRDLGFGQFRPSIAIAGDKYLFDFGGEPGAAGTQAAVAAGSVRTHVQTMPPVVLGATDQLLLALYSPSQSAAGVYKVRMGWVER